MLAQTCQVTCYSSLKVLTYITSAPIFLYPSELGHLKLLVCFIRELQGIL